MVLPVSSHLPWSSPCAPRLDFPNLLFSEQFSYDTAEFTLCYGLHDCSPSFEDFIHPLSTLHYCNAPDLATRLTGDYRGRTYTDRHGPASLDTRASKKPQEITFLWFLSAEMYYKICQLHLSNTRQYQRWNRFSAIQSSFGKIISCLYKQMISQLHAQLQNPMIFLHH